MYRMRPPDMWIVILLIYHLSPASAQFVYTDLDAFNKTCTSDADCRNIHTGAICSTLLSLNPSPKDYCVCDKTQNYHLLGNTCVLHVGLNSPCDGAVCKEPHSECVYTGGLSGRRRCECKDGMRQVHHEDAIKCAFVISRFVDAACLSCEKNEGVCYSMDGATRTGCLCPVSLTGDNCQNTHVFVKCTLKDFRMRICYKPHEGVNFTTGASIYANGYGNKVACQGMPAGDDCGPGLYKLELPLADEDRTTCGTNKDYIDGGNAIKYHNQIVVSRGRGHALDSPIVFTTYCTFTKRTQSSSSNMAVTQWTEGDAGQENLPDLSLIVRDVLGQSIPIGKALRIGDQISFILQLHRDGKYSALRVEDCLLTSSAISGDPKAVFLPILQDSCPAPGQTIMTSSNMFRSESGVSRHVTRSGQVRAVKLSTGSSTYLQCVVKLCLVGDEQSCEQGNCDTSGQPLLARRRRSTTEVGPGYVEISQPINFWQDEGDQGAGEVVVLDKTVFVAGVSIGSLVLILLLCSTALLSWRLYKSRSSTNKLAPQTFFASRLSKA